MIRFLGRERILSAREWIERARTGNLRDEDLCLTFDDNLRCQFDVARSVLEKWGITAFFFAYTSVLEGKIEKLEVYRYYRTMRFDGIEDFYRAFWKQAQQGAWAKLIEPRMRAFRPGEYLKDFPFYSQEDRAFRYVRDEVLGPVRYERVMDEMIAAAGVNAANWAGRLWMDGGCLKRLHAEGHVIGLHSHSHPTRLERLDAAGQRQEYSDNAACLTQLLGEKPVAMSHPCNSYNQTTLDILREMGIRVGFRANMAMETPSELEYPREDHANVLRMMAS